jgi:HSP20 family molecular chaperone IbpA
MTGAIAERKKEEVSNPDRGEHVRDRRVFVPQSDIYETKDKIVVLADMPGVDQQSIEITLEKNTLSIQGFTFSQAIEGLKLVYSECPEGNYRRVFSLSEEVDRDAIEATIKNGVLKLVLPNVRNNVIRPAVNNEIQPEKR